MYFEHDIIIMTCMHITILIHITNLSMYNNSNRIVYIIQVVRTFDTFQYLSIVLPDDDDDKVNLCNMVSRMVVIGH